MERKFKIIIATSMFVIFIISITLSYVFFYPGSIKHPDNPGDPDSPIEVNLKVSDNVIAMLNSTEDKIISAIGDASRLWSMFSTHSKLNVTFFGKNHRLEPISYDNITCESDQSSDIQTQLQEQTENSDNTSIQIIVKNEIIAPGIVDPDCTGPACTHIWSCERSGDKNEIKQFDIQLNLANYDIRAENLNETEYDLKTLIAHHIGHAIGLSHCLPGDTSASCSAKLSISMSDPSENAIMYKRIFPGRVISDLSDDDRIGIIALYGELQQARMDIQNEMQSFIIKANEGCPCLLPQDETDPRYVLSTNENDSLVEYNQNLGNKGLNTPEIRLEYAHYYQDLHLKAYSKVSIPAERYLSDGLNNMNTLLQQIPIERLQGMREVIVANIQEKKSIIDNFHYELDPRFYEFTQAELNTIIKIRKAIIDEIDKR